MKKIILFVVICYGLANANIEAQLIYDGGIRQDNVKLTTSQIKELFSEDSEAMRLYDKGKTQKVIGQIIF